MNIKKSKLRLFLTKIGLSKYSHRGYLFIYLLYKFIHFIFDIAT